MGGPRKRPDAGKKRSEPPMRIQLMPHHVDMHRERQPSGFCSPLNHAAQCPSWPKDWPRSLRKASAPFDRKLQTRAGRGGTSPIDEQGAGQAKSIAIQKTPSKGALKR